MIDTLIWSIFWASVAWIIATVCSLRILLEKFRKKSVKLTRYFFLGIFAVFIILGVILIVLTIQKEVEGTSKVFLLLTGASAVGMSIFAILHNLVTAMIIKFFRVRTDFDEPVFFLLAVIVCPLGFLAGVVGTIVLALI